MYIITPSDQISQLLSYFSGPKTSGAKNKIIKNKLFILILNTRMYSHNKT